jgi:hypothetical protein
MSHRLRPGELPTEHQLKVFGALSEVMHERSKSNDLLELGQQTNVEPRSLQRFPASLGEQYTSGVQDKRRVAAQGRFSSRAVRVRR